MVNRKGLSSVRQRVWSRGAVLDHVQQTKEAKVYTTGYHKGRRDEVKRLYWVLKNLRDGNRDGDFYRRTTKRRRTCVRTARLSSLIQSHRFPMRGRHWKGHSIFSAARGVAILLRHKRERVSAKRATDV